MTVKASAAGALMLAAGLFVIHRSDHRRRQQAAKAPPPPKSEWTLRQPTSPVPRYWKKNTKRDTGRRPNPPRPGKAAEKAVGATPARQCGIGHANAPRIRPMRRRQAPGRCRKRCRRKPTRSCWRRRTIRLTGSYHRRRWPPRRLNDVNRAAILLRRLPGGAVAMAQANRRSRKTPLQASNNDSLDKTSLIRSLHCLRHLPGAHA